MDEPTAQFNSYVHVADSDGAFHVFSPGDPVPGWARPLVGDHVLTYDGLAQAVVDEVFADVVADIARPEAYTTDPDDDSDIEGGEAPVRGPAMPPTSGPGSSAQAWVQYSHALGEKTPTMKWSRQQVIDLLVRKGLITDE